MIAEPVLADEGTLGSLIEKDVPAWLKVLVALIAVKCVIIGHRWEEARRASVDSALAHIERHRNLSFNVSSLNVKYNESTSS